MKIPCCTCSCIELRRCSYQIATGNAQQKYTDELGICICLSASDIENCFPTLANCASCLQCNPGALGCVGDLLAEIVTCAKQCPEQFLLSKNTACEILFLPHACKIGSQEVCNPEAVFPNWSTIKQLLAKLEQQVRGPANQFVLTSSTAALVPGTNGLSYSNHSAGPVQSALFLNRIVPLYNVQ